MRVDKVDTLKGNIMIADFMGWVHHKDKYYDDIEMAKLKYHSSWDALLPVVLKLEDKGVVVNIFYMNCHIEWSDEDNGYEVNTGIQGESKIDAVWTSICYFLSWVKDSDVDMDNPVNYE